MTDIYDNLDDYEYLDDIKDDIVDYDEYAEV